MVELTHDSRPIIGRGPPLTAYFLTLAAISIGLMVADQRYQQIDRMRESLSTVIYPVQRAVDFPFRATDWVTGSFADRSRLRQENLELTARLRLANLQLQRFAVLEEENRRLRDMRANTAGIAEKVLVASILSVDLDPFRHRVLLNMGARDGVFKGQAVLDGEGIFGQVAKVNASTAEVILISDAEHAIPVQSNRSGVRTIAVGTGDENTLSLPFVTVESDLQGGRPAALDRHGRHLPARLSGRARVQGEARRQHVCAGRGAAHRKARPGSRSAADLVQGAGVRGRACGHAGRRSAGCGREAASRCCGACAKPSATPAAATRRPARLPLLLPMLPLQTQPPLLPLLPAPRLPPLPPPSPLPPFPRPQEGGE